MRQFKSRLMVLEMVVLSLLVLAPPAQGRPDYTYGYCAGDGVRLRSGPGERTTVVAAMPRGTSLGVLQRKDGWAEVVPLQVYVAGNAVGTDKRIGAGGADVWLEPGRTKLGRLKGGERLEDVCPGQPYALIEPPSRLRFWVADRFVLSEGVEVRPGELVTPHRMSISPADYRKIAALSGLRMVVLPAGAPGTPNLESAESGRFGPGYSVRYTVGREWYTISTATSGEGGPDIGRFLFTLQTPLLGVVVVGTMNYGNLQELMMRAPRLLGGSLYQGKSCSISVNFSCSKGLDEATIRKVLQSLRAVRL